MSEYSGPDETFADVLNGLTGGGSRRPARRPPEPAEPVVPGGESVWSEPAVSPVDFVVHPVLDVDRLAMDFGIASDAAIVRPYSWTRGRTKSTVDLRIEALVTTSERGDDIDAMSATEHRSVAELCREPRSIAEIATLLGVPLGVAKVLVGDMAGLGLVVVHKTATGGANKAHLLLMERVLSGLRRL
jgi:hypothetical protein